MSFQQALSGLNATAKSLEVIGNNIANANTFGAKTSRAEFADAYAAALNGSGGSSIGIGTTLASVAQQFSQGNITATDNPMDLAINGRGFFQLQAPDGGTVYSRNGQFKVDRAGYIVNDQGMKLMAQAWDSAAGRATGDAAPIKLDTSMGQPTATGAGLDPALRGVQMSLNLDSRAGGSAMIPASTAVDFTKPDTYNFSTSQTVYDQLGAPLTMSYYFRDTGTDVATGDTMWDVYATINGQSIDGTTNVSGAKLTTLMFDPKTGGLDAAATGNPVTFDVKDPRVATGSPAVSTTTLFTGLNFAFDGTTQYAATSSVSEMKQDGFAAGQLTGITIDNSGVFKASYSNGRSSNLAQLEIADFTNLQGLAPLGGNVWKATYTSGDVSSKGVPGSGSLGAIQAGALEESNVDLTAELVNMITAQRAYQANAQTIKTEDQVMQSLVNLR